MNGSYEPGRGFTGDPRLGLARALMGQGASTAPVQSPLEGLARALQGGLGGYMAGNVKRSGQEGMAAALAALQDQSTPADQRLSAATAAYAKANPGGDNPLEGAQMNALMQALLPKKAESGLGKLVDDMGRLPADHPLRKVFETALAKDAGTPEYLRTSEAAKGQGGYDAKVAGEPALINATAQPKAAAAALEESAKNPALIARTGGQAQATANVDLRMKPQIEARTLEATTPETVRRAGQVAEATATAGLPGKEFDRANSLRDEYTKLTGDFRTVVDAHNKMQEAAKSPTGAGDMSLLYSYVKLLDPGSVVRESEFATAAASGSLGERVQGLVNRVISGERLPDTLRQEFVEQGSKIYQAQKRSYDNVAKQYTDLATRYGLKPENVVTRFDAGAAPKEAAGAPGNVPGAPRITEDASGRIAFDRLPKGASFYTPTGELRIKQ